VLIVENGIILQRGLKEKLVPNVILLLTFPIPVNLRKGALQKRQ